MISMMFFIVGADDIMIEKLLSIVVRIALLQLENMQDVDTLQMCQSCI